MSSMWKYTRAPMRTTGTCGRTRTRKHVRLTPRCSAASGSVSRLGSRTVAPIEAVLDILEHVRHLLRHALHIAKCTGRTPQKHAHLLAVAG
jgi:hypothetical protein